MGLETEYALAPHDGDGLDRPAIDAQMQAVAQIDRFARQVKPNLPSENACGIFLPGGRFYIDSGHPEFATAECADPWELVRYVRAGEKMLQSLARRIRRHDDVRFGLFRCNVDYSGAETTWGCHESYLHTIELNAIFSQILPHLVSRLIYTGAGGFDASAQGIRFEVSPRVPHLEMDISGSSTQGRGIFHTKRESLGKRPYGRLHVLCGESLCSHFGVWLRSGTTALVLAMIEAGVPFAERLSLRDPLRAMHRFSADTTCTATVELDDGRRLSAVDIQRHYLDEAKRRLGERSMPPWAETVCRRWGEVLDRLEESPESLATSLDWPMKLALVRDHVAATCEAPWEILTACAARPDPDDVFASMRSRLRGDYHERLKGRSVSPGCFPALAELRNRLFELDMRFGQLSPPGVFDALDARGVLDHRLEDGDDEVSVLTVPSGGRARTRGKMIHALKGGGDRYSCSWTAVFDLREHRELDLSDPFEQSPSWGVRRESDPLAAIRHVSAESPGSAARPCRPGTRVRIVGSAVPYQVRFVDQVARVVDVEVRSRIVCYRLDIDGGRSLWLPRHLCPLEETSSAPSEA